MSNGFFLTPEESARMNTLSTACETAEDTLIEAQDTLVNLTLSTAEAPNHLTDEMLTAADKVAVAAKGYWEALGVLMEYVHECRGAHSNDQPTV